MTRISKPAHADYATSVLSIKRRKRILAPKRRTATLYRGSTVFAHCAAPQTNLLHLKLAAARARMLASMRLQTRLMRRRSHSTKNILADDTADWDDDVTDAHDRISSIGERNSSGGDSGRERGQQDNEQEVDSESEIASFRKSKVAQYGVISRYDSGPLCELTQSGDTIAGQDAIRILTTQLLNLRNQLQKNPSSKIDAHIHQLSIDCLQLQPRVMTEDLSLQQVVAILANIQQGEAPSIARAKIDNLDRVQRLNVTTALIVFNALRRRTPSQLERAKSYRKLQLVSPVSRSVDTMV